MPRLHVHNKHSLDTGRVSERLLALAIDWLLRTPALAHIPFAGKNREIMLRAQAFFYGSTPPKLVIRLLRGWGGGGTGKAEHMQEGRAEAPLLAKQVLPFFSS